MVTPISPVGHAPPPPAAAQPTTTAAPLDTEATALLADLPAHSPLRGLRQDLSVTDRLTQPGPHAVLRAALLHHGGTLEGLHQLHGASPPHPSPDSPP